MVLGQGLSSPSSASFVARASARATMPQRGATANGTDPNVCV